MKNSQMILTGYDVTT